MTEQSQHIQKERIRWLTRKEIRRRDYVLYWMQQSQRAHYNHALEFAVQQANEMGQPLLVVFGLMNQYPEANLRHYTFMLEGLRETQVSLAERGIRMVVVAGSPDQVAARFCEDASLVVCDKGYLRHQKRWRSSVADRARCPAVEVESDVVVPVEVASHKAEFAARTIRPKIHSHLSDYMVALRGTPLRHHLRRIAIRDVDLGELEGALRKIKMDRSVGAVSHLFKGGTEQAKRKFRDFMKRGLKRYEANRNQPHTDDVSGMSPYLHFGQISPLYLAVQVGGITDHRRKDRDAFLEELLVRRELAVNFVHFTSAYDSFRSLPDWAKETLKEHKKDKRKHVYTVSQLENAETHDEYWNAAMREMKQTGYMHNYMRMYWGKKILQWSNTPAHAYRTALTLNNRYFLDGRDPSSFSNIGWVFGLHDRPWGERPVFGKVRYMSASGLERKCDMSAYIRKVDDLSSWNPGAGPSEKQ